MYHVLFSFALLWFHYIPSARPFVTSGIMFRPSIVSSNVFLIPKFRSRRSIVITRTFSSEQSPIGPGSYEEFAQRSSVFFSKMYEYARTGQLLLDLKKDILVSTNSLFRNIQQGTWGERGEQWVASQLILIGFIVSNTLPFSWLLKCLGVLLVSFGALMGIASALALKVRHRE